MIQKTKSDYQKEILIKRKIANFSFVYVIVWALIFIVLYFFQGIFDITFLSAVFIIIWIIAYIILLFSGEVPQETKKRFEEKIKIQSDKLLAHQRKFNGEYDLFSSTQRNFYKIKNRLTKFRTQLDMLGFDKG